MSRIIGIDLGTSTSEAAVFEDGRASLIPGPEGAPIIPSVIGIDDAGNWVCGERARSQLLLSPERTAMEVKRLIGTDTMVPIGKERFSPVDLSARLLGFIKSYASESLQEEITRAVISVPAYFDDIQRQEIVTAGSMAGLSVERILNEPTAAALSYGLDHTEEESHILVYDLGGGTFDVTLLEMFDGVLEVKASNGDNQLGGKDFDQRLIDYLADAFEEQYGLDLRRDVMARSRLKDEAERCKKVLSEEQEVQVRLPLIAKKAGKPLSLEQTLTRETFEKLCKDLLERTHLPIDIVLEDAGISAGEIDRIILVGGSTRIPMVSADITEYLGQAPQSDVDPDLAVARGTAIMAGMIEGRIDPAEGVILTDVNPYTLGVRVKTEFSYDHMDVLIPRNRTIPVRKMRSYTTSFDRQTEAMIEVYQGESEIASSNHMLGKFLIGGIPPRKAGKEEIQVTFAYNLNGMLDVSAVIQSTGNNASIRIDMMNKAEQEIDPEAWTQAKLAKRYRAQIRWVEKRLAEGTALETIWYGEVEQLLTDLKTAIVLDQEDVAQELSDQILDQME